MLDHIWKILAIFKYNDLVSNLRRKNNNNIYIYKNQYYKIKLKHLIVPEYSV